MKSSMIKFAGMAALGVAGSLVAQEGIAPRPPVENAPNVIISPAPEATLPAEIPVQGAPGVVIEQGAPATSTFEIPAAPPIEGSVIPAGPAPVHELAPIVDAGPVQIVGTPVANVVVGNPGCQCACPHRGVVGGSGVAVTRDVVVWRGTSRVSSGVVTTSGAIVYGAGSLHGGYQGPAHLSGTHVRYPYYNYRAPWVSSGPASINHTIVW